MGRIKELIKFIQDVAKDNRIPESDKAILVVLIALIISPVDIIPDWIPIVGLMDDVVLLAIVLDYFFNHLDQEILLSHYPWGMKSFTRIRSAARMISLITPGWVKEKVWKFKPSVYK
ncbi:MAG: YkvA family protein [Bdellovibrionales bacterium]